MGIPFEPKCMSSLCIPQTNERADTSRGQKRRNPCPSSLRASDMFARVQQLISVHDNMRHIPLNFRFYGKNINDLSCNYFGAIED